MLQRLRYQTAMVEIAVDQRCNLINARLQPCTRSSAPSQAHQNTRTVTRYDRAKPQYYNTLQGCVRMRLPKRRVDCRPSNHHSLIDRLAFHRCCQLYPSTRRCSPFVWHDSSSLLCQRRLALRQSRVLLHHLRVLNTLLKVSLLLF